MGGEEELPLKKGEEGVLHFGHIFELFVSLGRVFPICLSALGPIYKFL